MSDDKAVLKLPKEDIELPVHRPSIGQEVIDIKSLGKQGYFTFDPGLLSVATW